MSRSFINFFCKIQNYHKNLTNKFLFFKIYLNIKYLIFVIIFLKKFSRHLFTIKFNIELKNK